ncbi:MAG: CYTH domain-containing protein [Mogibacterium sp.]|nr:CYTH domain-containing protein [Mogibacterium sp.]
METEFKYRIDDIRLIHEIINDPLLDHFINRSQIEEIEMHAVYFDTEEQDLRRAGIAYRIRRENDRITATIKWAGNVENGLHSREEFNLVINDEAFADNPNIDVFESSDAYDVLFQAAGHKPLVKTVEMDFTRQMVKVDTGLSISALSFDVGTVAGRERKSDIMEMELEWYHGNEEDFRDVALSIADKYGLEAENASKLQRGFLEEYDGK